MGALTAALWLGSVLGAVVSTDPGVRAPWFEARRLRAEGREQEAMVAYREAIRDDARNAMLLAEAAACAQALGAPQEAAHLELLVVRWGSSAERAEAYRQLGTKLGRVEDPDSPELAAPAELSCEARVRVTRDGYAHSGTAYDDETREWLRLESCGAECPPMPFDEEASEEELEARGAKFVTSLKHTHLSYGFAKPWRCDTSPVVREWAARCAAAKGEKATSLSASPCFRRLCLRARALLSDDQSWPDARFDTRAVPVPPDAPWVEPAAGWPQLGWELVDWDEEYGCKTCQTSIDETTCQLVVVDPCRRFAGGVCTTRRAGVVTRVDAVEVPLP